MSSKLWKSRLAPFLLLLPLFLVVGWVVYAIIGPPEVLSPGKSVHFDDWFFTAKNARRLDRLDQNRAPAGSAFYVVDVVVRSEAKRVSFDFKPETVRATLNSVVLTPAGQTSQRSGDWTVDPGQEATFQLAFVGPKNGKDLRIKFEAGGVGEFLDALLGQKEEVRFPTVPTKSS